METSKNVEPPMQRKMTEVRVGVRKCWVGLKVGKGGDVFA